MNNTYPDYIVVEGPIGVGKTSLAKSLAATFQTDLMLEMEEENPFLPRFYANHKSVALPTQLYFLFQRARQIEMLKQKDMFKPIQVADFLIEKDKLFAQITLDDDELDLYQQVYARLTLDAPVPDLVIYLQAPVEVLMQRIIERGHEYEKLIEKSYLQQVADAYVDFFYHYSTAPLLIVNTIDFDLVNGIQDYNLLLEQIQYLKSGKHYFNPKEL